MSCPALAASSSLTERAAAVGVVVAAEGDAFCTWAGEAEGPLEGWRAGGGGRSAAEGGLGEPAAGRPAAPTQLPACTHIRVRQLGEMAVSAMAG